MKIRIASFFVLISFIYYANSKETSCMVTTVPSECTNEYIPVCGLYDPAQIQCVKAPCGETFDNVCYACHDSRVKSYFDGPCDETPDEVDDCEEEEIDPELSQDVPQTPDLTESNDLYECQPNDRLISCLCIRGGDFYCAHKTDNTTYYVGCPCSACSNKDVDIVTKGLCPEHKLLSNYEVTHCNPIDPSNPIYCTMQYIGVCAITYDGLKEVGTACQGCQQDGIFAVYNGKCPN
jgi:hypothetical protein